MLTYLELTSLHTRLIKGEISLGEAKAICWKGFKPDQRSWHTKDWKSRRDPLIKDKCEICGGTEVLTIQHRSHPASFGEHKKRLTKEFTKKYLSEHPVINRDELKRYINSNYEFSETPLCPNCKARKPRRRISKKPEFSCGDCHQEFETPMYQTLDEVLDLYFNNEDDYALRDKCFISKQWNNGQNMNNITYWFKREQAKAELNEQIEKEAFLSYLADGIHYLSLKDTITACRKCAYHYDIKNLELCPSCKTYFKGLNYATCIQCLPEAQRKAALEKIAFAKDMEQMHKDLGID